MTENANHDPVVIEGETPEAAEATGGASAEGCPVVHGRVDPTQGDANSQWWPNRLNLRILAKNPVATDPYHGEFDYAAEFKTLRTDQDSAGGVGIRLTRGESVTLRGQCS